MMSDPRRPTPDTVSPWRPTSDPLDLAHLGKLAEELGECSAATSRCLIQGILECEPVTGKSNKVWLEEEMADVIANMKLNILRFGLDEAKIQARVVKKRAHLKRWHALIVGIIR